MKKITILCKREDEELINAVKNEFKDVTISTKTASISVETWVMMSISIASLTMQTIDFFEKHLNKKADRKIDTKDGEISLDVNSKEELKEELEDSFNE